MKKLKVITVVGTRPEIIRLSRVIAKLDDSESIEHILVHTGQNYDYELNEIFFKDLEIRKPNYFLDAAGRNAIETIGNVIIKIDPVLGKEKPDAFLVLGDTNSSLCAIPAKKRKIPVFHMEAGNRCFDQRVPEETNRKIVDHISDINLPYSTISRDYLIREGFPPDRIIKTGSPMCEVLHHYLPKVKNSQVLRQLNLSEKEFFLVSAHREENIESDVLYKKLIDILNGLAEKFGKDIIVSGHPRTRNRIDREKETLHPLVKLLKPLGFIDYVHLQLHAIATLSDSGTITEESSILNFPALNIREAHERPEGMEEAAVMMPGLNIDRILQCLAVLYSRRGDGTSHVRIVSDYDVPDVANKVVRIILSYTDYINRVVWSK